MLMDIEPLLGWKAVGVELRGRLVGNDHRSRAVGTNPVTVVAVTTRPPPPSSQHHSVLWGIF